MKIFEPVRRFFGNIFYALLRGCFAVSNVFCPSEYALDESHFGARHGQCLMAFLGVAIAYCLRTNISVAIVSMTEKSSLNADAPVLMWDEKMKGTILSSFFWGYLLLQIPGGQMAEKFGPKYVLITAVGVAGILTILTPYAAINGGFYWMVLSRILQGAAQGFCYPATNFFLAKWAPLPERGRLVTSVFSGDRFGILITMAGAGVLADSRWGWPSIFYVSGATAILWALAYAYFGVNYPQDHPTITDAERSYILDSLPNTSEDRQSMKTPWKAILKSGPLWALLLVHCGQNWGYYTLLTQIPSYIYAVFGLNIQESGFLSALPYVSSFIMAFVFAVIGDKVANKEMLSKTTARKCWNSCGLWGGAAAFCLLAFAGEYEYLALTLLILAAGLNGATLIGYHSNHLDLAPNFSGTLMGITNGFGNVASISAPLFAGFMLTDMTSLSEWRIVFLTSAAVFFVGNLIFVIFGTAEVQDWNFPPEKEKPIQMTNIFTERITED
nr:PREDICTED: putative inorganic phosphate cotransporter isoform X2 [Bemisia tabaci]